MPATYCKFERILSLFGDAAYFLQSSIEPEAPGGVRLRVIGTAACP
jgi:hypothetical protein